MYLAGREHFSIVTDHKPLLQIINTKSLCDIENPRLQRLREKLIPYNFTLEWKKGSDHAVPDALSRSPVESPTREDEVAENELEEHMHNLVIANVSSMSEDIKYPDLLLEEICKYSNQDPEYNALRKTIIQGFPSNHNELEPCVQPYAKMKDLLSVDGRLIICGQRLVIPTQLRKEVLKHLHSSHQGIDKTRRRARQSVYWPGIDNDIKNTTNTCKECQAFLPSIQKEPIIQVEEPSRPFESVSSDYFQHAGHEYLIYTDRLSGWPMVKMFRNGATAVKLISTLRKFFAATGIPEALRADNGPQYTAAAFRKFLREWAVRIITSSPYYPQSNGHAESSVKAVKHLIVKCTRRGNLDTDEFAFGLLELRNSPRADGRSPAQVLFGHPIRSLVPVHKLAYSAEWQRNEDDCQKKRAELKEKVEYRYNLNAKPLPPFRVGSRVLIQDQKTKRWTINGTITKVGAYRQYEVKKDGGKLVWRNRRHLRQRYPIVQQPSTATKQPSQSLQSPATPSNQLTSNDLQTPVSNTHHDEFPTPTLTPNSYNTPPKRMEHHDIPVLTPNPPYKIPADIRKNKNISPSKPNSPNSSDTDSVTPLPARRRQTTRRLQVNPRDKSYKQK